MALSAGQLIALRNLASKQAGDEVDWINISDARALTELGFANRSREGWQITPEGSSALQSAEAEGAGVEDLGGHEPIAMKRVDHEGN